VSPAPFHIDEPGVSFGAIADEPARPQSRKIDTDRHSLAQVGIVGIDQTLACVQGAQGIGIEQSLSAAETNFCQPRAFTDQNRNCAWPELGLARAMIADRESMEAACLIGHRARKDIKAAG